MVKKTYSHSCFGKNSEMRRFSYSIAFILYPHTLQTFATPVAAVKAGMGITLLPRNMITENLQIIRRKKQLSNLDDTHISLLKRHNKNLAVNSFEKFVVERLNQ